MDTGSGYEPRYPARRMNCGLIPGLWKEVNWSRHFFSSRIGWGLGTSLNNTITTPGVKLLNYLRTSPSGRMGHIEAPHMKHLIEKTAKGIADQLKQQQVDIALLVPA